MTDERYADADLTELVQAAFDKHILERLPALLEKHLPMVDQIVVDRITGKGYAPEFNSAIHKRVEEIVETTIGNCLRVGRGRDIIDTAILAYLDKKLDQHVEDHVKWRVNRLMEKLKKDFEKTMTVA
jgi:hypothetical protein